MKTTKKSSTTKNYMKGRKENPTHETQNKLKILQRFMFKGN